MSQSTLAESPYFNSNLFSGYYLDERVDDLEEWDCDEAAEAAFSELRETWEKERDLVETYKEDELLGAWIDEVLDVLGFDSLQETTLPDGEGYNDRLLFDGEADRLEGARRKSKGDVEGMYGIASVVLEAKQWNASFDQKFEEHRSYRDASHQVKYYLERTPEALDWGILTDGRKWRLYGTKDYATETYYQIDLAELLETGDLETFKYFYTFFRPEAFRSVAGTTFLDTVWSESETAAQELGEDLQDNVFTALRVLGEGFIETNDLDLDPDDAGAREQLKEQSLVLLYRLMFLLYAESRNLIHPEDPSAKDEYDAKFSLDALRQDIHHDIEAGGAFDDFSEHSTSHWSRLQDLFRLVDNGEPSLGIPAYNGGLFDDERHDFLAEHAVADRYIDEVVYRLGTTKTEDGEFVLADYADLDTRHLGSIYEGLLEHEFRIAPEQYAAVSEDGGQVWQPATDVSVADAVETVDPGELYVVNDDGERKATGAYYTPDYVVAYIVEETIDPLLEGIDDDLREMGLEPSDQEYFGRYWRRVQTLKILDPAMGSGHFLTKATGYLTEQVMQVVREGEQGRDEQVIRRTIAKECIYGVDLNGMAAELAKLSMWLETLATDKPLAFLDHHLKTGNSLVGSDITEVLSNGNGDTDDGQITIFQAAARVQQQTLEHVMELMEDLLAIDNESLDDIKSMEEIYDEIRADPLYQRLFQLANVHTAERFGVDVPEGAYEDMAKAIEDAEEWAEIEDEDWFVAAQATAEAETFFHWELEYPEVFFGEDGEKRGDAGFDAVVGNPPYFNLETTKGTSFNEYLSNEYSKIHSGKADILYYFCDRSIDLYRNGGYLTFIVSRYFTEAFNAKDFREKLTDENDIRQILDLGNNQVFPGVDTLTVALSFGSSGRFERTSVIQLDDSLSSNEVRIAQTIGDLQESGDSEFGSKYTVPETEFGRERWLILPKEIRDVKNRIESNGTSLGKFCRTGQGMMTGLNEAFTVSKTEIEKFDIEEDALKPLVKNGDLRRYIYLGNELELIYLENKFIDDYPHTKAYLEQYKEGLETRAKADKVDWYRYQNPINKDLFEEYDQRIICPFIATDNRFYVDSDGLYNDGGDIEVIVQNTSSQLSDYYLVAVLNSQLLEFYHLRHAKLKRDGFFEYFGNSLRQLPIADSPQEREIPSSDNPHEDLQDYAMEMGKLKEKKLDLNLSLLDHLGNYADGPTLADVGLTQPPEGAADSILQETATEKPNLRVGDATVVRESPNTVEIRLTARYKPDEGTDHATDQWGYTETDPRPALRITDLSEPEADLIEAFVPVAVDEAGGFADFRETATQTNSPIDRVRKLTLPAVEDVRDGLDSYVETMARAEELEAKIERTDDLIDEIVYELYGLTEEEIEIVEEAVEE